MERRTFLKGIASAGAVTFMGYSSLFGASAPSNKVKVALIGCRNMGWSNLEVFLDYRQVECIALCDIDDEWLNKRAADVLKKTGKKPLLVKDWRKIIDNKDVDLVIISTPDHWHCLPMIEACQAGKDVYIEKPLSNTIEECVLMEKAVAKYNRVVQVGQWQRSDQHWNDAAAFVSAEKIGRVRTVKAWAYQPHKSAIPKVPDDIVPAGVDYDMWLGPAPKRPFNKNRFHYNFRFFWDYAGGLMSDWGVHLLDYAMEGMKVDLPEYISGVGGNYAYPNDAMETPDTLAVIYKYPEFNMIWEHACGISHGLFGKREGVAFYGENGTLILTRDGWEVMPVENRMAPVAFKKGHGKGLYNHVGNTLDCMVTRNKPNADISIGAKVAKLCLFGNISSRVGTSLLWDKSSGSFVNNPQADVLSKAYYRAPWELPVL